MEKSRAIELLKLAVPIKALTQQEYSDFVEAVNMGMDALKEQLLREGTTKDATSDMISKTDTVEHLRRVLEATVPNTDYDEGYIDGIEFGISTVSTMPTIQPQSTAGQLNDSAQSTAQSTNLIDRQAAIDAVMDEFRRIPTNAEIRAKARLEELPTVRLEPSIPLSWIEGQIARLKNTDNYFAILTANIIKTMLDEWRKGEQDENN